jgi:hypothetical protein
MDYALTKLVPFWRREDGHGCIAKYGVYGEIASSPTGSSAHVSARRNKLANLTVKGMDAEKGLKVGPEDRKVIVNS